MISIDDAQTVLGRGGRVLGADGSGLGTIGSVYLDDTTGDPAWVSAGGDRGDVLVPLAGGRIDGDDIWVPCTRQQVDGAPQVRPQDGRLSPEDDATLHRYYEGAGHPADERLGPVADAGGPEDDMPEDDVPEDDGAAVAAPDEDLRGGRDLRGDRDGRDGAVGSDAVGSGEVGDGSVVRSEEQLRIRTERVPVRRVRLRKVVVTEQVTQTVPVSHEEFRLEEVPYDAVDDGDVLVGDTGTVGDGGFDGFEVILREERIVVTKEVAAVERVRVRVEAVTGERRVSADVQKERVVADETKVSDLG